MSHNEFLILNIFHTYMSLREKKKMKKVRLKKNKVPSDSYNCSGQNIVVIPESDLSSISLPVKKDKCWLLGFNSQIQQ